MSVIALPFLNPLTEREADGARLGLFTALSVVGLIVGAVATGGLFAATGLDATVEAAMTGGAAAGPEALGFMAALAIGLAALAAPVLIAARLAYGRPLASFLWPGRRPSWRLAALGGGAMTAAALVVSGLGWLVSGAPSGAEAFAPPAFWSLSGGAVAIHAAVAVAAVLIAAAAEEAVFRGVLLQISAGFLRSSWALCLLNGLMFAAIHFDPDPVAFVARTASGMVWAWAALRLGGLEFAIGAHAAGNLLIALTSDFAEAVQPGRSFDLTALAVNLGISLLMLGVVEAVARRRNA